MAIRTTTHASPYHVPLSALRYLPQSLQHLVVSVALSHRIISANGGRGLQQQDNSGLVPRLHRYRHSAIRWLNVELSEKDAQLKDSTITSVTVCLMAEVSALLSLIVPLLTMPQLAQATSAAWQHHIEGAMTLVRLRGGLPQILIDSPLVTPYIRYLVM